MNTRNEADRAARNEALFRRVNERVEEVNKAFEPIIGETDFFCECANIECMEKIRMSLAEYEALRQDATRFATRPGHDDPATERLVEKRVGYVIVEKIGAAGERAEQLDPRE